MAQKPTIDDAVSPDAALKRLSDRLDAVESHRHGKNSQTGRGSAIGLGYRLSFELVIGLLVGGFIGWWIDDVLSTKPLFLLVMLCFGMAAGVLNTVRTAENIRQKNMSEQNLSEQNLSKMPDASGKQNDSHKRNDSGKQHNHEKRDNMSIDSDKSATPSATPTASTAPAAPVAPVGSATPTAPDTEKIEN